MPTDQIKLSLDNRGTALCPFGYVYFGESNVRAVYAASTPSLSDGPLQVHTGSGGWVNPSDEQRHAAADFLAEQFSCDVEVVESST